ncbi:hypothetical protein FA15DRAFT_551038, partial [Coprinopsis marcescibilis]
LQQSSTNYLCSSSPIKSASLIPEMPTIAISPVKKLQAVADRRYTKAEVDVMLTEKQALINYWKGTALRQQAMLVLLTLYSRRVCQQLNAKEEKEKKKTNLKITNDGHGRLMTMPEIIERTAAVEKAQEDTAKEKADRRAVKMDHGRKLEEWKLKVEERDAENEARRQKWVEAVESWNREKAAAKAAGQKVKDWEVQNPKPKCKQAEFCALPRIPRPKVTTVSHNDEEGEFIDVDGIEDDGDDDD